MATTLIFNGVTLTPVTHQHGIWIRAAELARALGYAEDRAISRIYRKNADEFTPEMTQVIEISVESRNGSLGNLSEGRCRIFSLRGCHLVAMFSRTKVARDFRRWVLDLLERLEETPGQQGTQAQRRNITEDIIPAPDGASVAESLFAAINNAARTTRPGEFGLLDLSCLAGKARTEQPQPEQPELPGYSVEELLEDSQNATRDIILLLKNVSLVTAPLPLALDAL